MKPRDETIMIIFLVASIFIGFGLISNYLVKLYNRVDILEKASKEIPEATRPTDTRSVHACMLYAYDRDNGVWNRILNKDGKPFIPDSVSMLSCYDPSVVQDMMMWRIQVDGWLQTVGRDVEKNSKYIHGLKEGARKLKSK
jgi:hypothetical protein